MEVRLDRYLRGDPADNFNVFESAVGMQQQAHVFYHRFQINSHLVRRWRTCIGKKIRNQLIESIGFPQHDLQQATIVATD